MRYLVLMIGSPSSGKSTWIKENNLEEFTISPDNIRVMLQSPDIDIYGRKFISQKNDKEVWDLVLNITEKRMKRGELIVIDATNSSTKLINKYNTLTKKYRYRIIGIDFRDVPLEQLLKQNRNRHPEYKRVPEDVIHKMYMRLQNLSISKKVELFPRTIKFDEIIKQKSIFDFSKYTKINFFGDIHGCFKEFKKSYESLQEDNCYNIFVGDYFDRFTNKEEVGELLKYLLSLPKENNLFLTGNHEKNYIYLDDYYKYLGLKIKDPEKYSKDYNEKVRKVIRSKQQRQTMFTFYELDLTKEIKEFSKRLAQMAFFKWNKKVVLVNHGGIPIAPDITTPTSLFINGVGDYDEYKEVCKSWGANTPANYYQVFGHRNTFNLAMIGRCYLIDSNAEFGGEYRALSLTEDGFKFHIEKSTREYKLDERVEPKIDENNLLKQFEGHKGVKITEPEDGLLAINFTSQVFKSGKYDDLTILARGLFIDKETGKIRARGYHKFFNLNEKEETKMSNLKNLKYPLIAYEKANGYLGILSVYEKYGKLNWHISSKSTTKGQFADNFRKMIEPKLTEELQKIIFKENISLTFEVIEPTFDPHIEKYNEPELVLLDGIRNKAKFEVITSKLLNNISKLLDVRTKAIERQLNSYEELYDYINELNLLSLYCEWKEGVVIQEVGTSPFMFKIKTEWYKFWKMVRGLIQSLYKRPLNYEHEVTFIRKLYTKEQMEVGLWVIEKYKQGIKYDNVIQLREEFLKERK